LGALRADSDPNCTQIGGWEGDVRRSVDDPAAGTTVEMHGATIIEVDADGLVTLWRDYLDRKEPENQLRAAVRGRPRRTGDG
jgi:hypothetical protein